VTYAGTSSEQTLDVGFQPDFSWFKVRDLGTQEHALFDVLRGNNRLTSDTTNDEEARPDDFTGFTSNGVTIKGTATFINNSSNNYVAWNWKANGAGVSNTAGTITSTVSVNTDSGFSIVTAAGQNNTSTLTIGHGLGVAPTMLIGKSRNGTGGWSVWHNALATNELVYLNTTAAKSVDGGTPPAAFTATSSTTFTVQNWNRMIGNGVDGVFYAFAPVAGYSAFGSYTGNGSADGPFVFTNFRPAFVMIKRSDNDGYDWVVVDNKRPDPFNVVDGYLQPNTSNAEIASDRLDILSNGFKLRTSAGGVNDPSATYIYAAFASSPFKLALAR
jgi:hypothetical protein